MKQILVVNDDGIHGPGLDPLARALAKVGRVTVVVPDQEKSTASHYLTLHKPVRVKEIARRIYILNGNPADCTRFGALSLLKGKVDLVVSGINKGLNLGDDVIYSGTVAAAIEANILGIPALAVSQDLSRKDYFRTAAYFAEKIAKNILFHNHHLPKKICLNINVPACSASNIRGIRIVKLGKRLYGRKVTICIDPRGRPCFWLMDKKVGEIAIPGSDVEAVRKRYVSITPLSLDWTDTAMMPRLKKISW